MCATRLGVTDRAASRCCWPALSRSHLRRRTDCHSAATTPPSRQRWRERAPAEWQRLVAGCVAQSEGWQRVPQPPAVHGLHHVLRDGVPAQVELGQAAVAGRCLPEAAGRRRRAGRTARAEDHAGRDEAAEDGGGGLINHSPRRLGPSCWREVYIGRVDNEATDLGRQVAAEQRQPAQPEQRRQALRQR